MSSTVNATSVQRHDPVVKRSKTRCDKRSPPFRFVLDSDLPGQNIGLRAVPAGLGYVPHVVLDLLRDRAQLVKNRKGPIDSLAPKESDAYSCVALT